MTPTVAEVNESIARKWSEAIDHHVGFVRVDSSHPFACYDSVLFAIREVTAPLEKQVAELQANCATMRKALEHFADEKHWSCPKGHLQNTYYEAWEGRQYPAKLAREALAADAGKALLDRLATAERILRTDHPRPLGEVLMRLVDAVNHLLNTHDCDHHGHESFAQARAEAVSLVQALEGK